MLSLNFPKYNLRIKSSENKTWVFDIIVVYNSNGSIHILVECKAPSIKITQQAFDQIAQYNMQLNATFLIVSNGLEHYFCKMDYQNKKYIFLNEIPDFKR